jgi:DNA-binding response OmpR family regulator
MRDSVSFLGVAVRPRIEHTKVADTSTVMKLLDRRYFLGLAAGATVVSRTQTCLLSLEALNVISIGGLVLNRNTKTVEINGRQMPLTNREYQLVAILSLHTGTTLNKDSLLHYLYHGMDMPEPRMMDVFIAGLRHKFCKASGGKPYIETVLGHGYMLRKPS